MAVIEVKAKVRPSPATTVKGKDGKDVVVPAFKGGETVAKYDLPTDLPGMIKAYGEPVVFAHAKGSIIISLQAAMRRLIEAGKSAADIQTAVTAFKPDVRTAVKQSAMEKATGAIKSLSADERKKLLAELQAMK